MELNDIVEAKEVDFNSGTLVEVAVCVFDVDAIVVDDMVVASPEIKVVDFFEIVTTVVEVMTDAAVVVVLTEIDDVVSIFKLCLTSLTDRSRERSASSEIKLVSSGWMSISCISSNKDDPILSSAASSVASDPV